MSSREWRWVNAITRNVEWKDWWYIILDHIYNNYPTTHDANELLKPPEQRYLLRDDIAWGISDNNFDSANKIATFNVTHNNSPQKTRIPGGARRNVLQFVITEFAYKWIKESTTDVYYAPPWEFMATKGIFENMLSANSEVLYDKGIRFIANPSTIQDGKNFANFSLGSNFAAGTQFFMDNNKWKNVLLWQLQIIEDLI